MCGGLQLLEISGVRVGIVVRLVVVAKVIPPPSAWLTAAALGLDFLSVNNCSTFL